MVFLLRVLRLFKPVQLCKTTNLERHFTKAERGRHPQRENPKPFGGFTWDPLKSVSQILQKYH
jgi:hypothetical protein